LTERYKTHRNNVYLDVDHSVLDIGYSLLYIGLVSPFSACDYSGVGIIVRCDSYDDIEMETVNGHLSDT
jgi:hypothetical protein